MAQSSLAEHEFNGILQHIDRIQRTTTNISQGSLIAFRPISLRQPSMSIPVHAFHTVVSWLYVLYQESGRTTYDFLNERAYALGLDPERMIAKHRTLVTTVRTYLQHNLDLSKPNDVAKRNYCLDWACECCQSSAVANDGWPTAAEGWSSLLNELLASTTRSLDIMQSALDAIAADDSRYDIVRVWEARSKRTPSPHEYDDIIKDAIATFGLAHLDAIALRNKYCDSWNRKLALINDPFDFKEEARYLVEHMLAVTESLPIRLSGEDIMREFGIPPGPLVRRVKTLAQQEYSRHPRDPKLILGDLKAEWQGGALPEA